MKTQADLFDTSDLFNLKGELLDNSLTPEGETRRNAENKANQNKAQQTFDDQPLNPIQKRLAAGMAPIAAFLTDATCGEACWEAREDVCRCCCGGKNHGCMRSKNGVRPIRNCKLNGVRRELKAVGGNAFELAREMNEAAGESFIFAATSQDPMFRLLPARLKTATDSQIEKWPELSGWRDEEHWTDEHGKRHYLNKPYLLWIKVNQIS